MRFLARKDVSRFEETPIEIGEFRADFNHDVSNKAHRTFFFPEVVTAGFFAAARECKGE